MSKDITPSVQVLGLSQAVLSKDMSRPNINTAEYSIVLIYKCCIVLYEKFVKEFCFHVLQKGKTKTSSIRSTTCVVYDIKQDVYKMCIHHSLS